MLQNLRFSVSCCLLTLSSIAVLFVLPINTNFALADDDDSGLTSTTDDEGNVTYYDDHGQPVKRTKLPYSPKKKPGKTIKLPDGTDATAEADGTIRYLDNKGNTIEIKQNPNNPNLHTIIQQLLNGINAITSESGKSVYNIPGSGNWTFGPNGLLEGTPYGPYSGPLPPDATRNTDNGITTTTYTDPTFGRTTTVVEGNTMKPTAPGMPGMPTTTITDPSGNKIVNTPKGPLIYGPDGKLISKAGFEPDPLGEGGHHHGTGGTEIPNIFFPVVKKPDAAQPKSLYMKSEPEISQEPTPDKPDAPYSSKFKIDAKQGGPFRITAEVAPNKPSSKTMSTK